MFLVDFVLNGVFKAGYIDQVCYLATLLLFFPTISHLCTSVALLVPARVASAIYKTEWTMEYIIVIGRMFFLVIFLHLPGD